VTMIAGLPSEEYKDLILSVGTHRGQRRLSPTEVSDLFQKARNHGASLHDCAQAVHLTTSMVSRFLKLQKLSIELKHLVDWGQANSVISFTSAFEISRLNEDEQGFVSEEILEHGLTKTEVQQVVQLRRRSKKDIKTCVNEILQLRPIICKRYVFIGSILKEDLKSFVRKIKQQDRDRLLSESLDAIFPDVSFFSARLGLDNFTIVTNDAGATVLNAEGEGFFEEKINTSLAKAI